MLSDEDLLLAVQDLAKINRRVPALLILAHIEQPAKTVAVRNKGLQIGFRAITQWNLSDVLKSAANEGQVAQLAHGWKLLTPGLKAIASHYNPEAPMVAETRHSLKSHLAKISNEQRRAFVEEAIRCFDAKAYRSAVVLSWVGAAHILQEHIVANHIGDFNAAGLARMARAASNGKTWSFTPVRTIKDFGTMGEADLLQLSQDASILHKAEKKILQDRLDLRNQCGHPNPLIVAEHAVASHLEILMLNVYSKY